MKKACTILLGSCLALAACHAGEAVQLPPNEFVSMAAVDEDRPHEKAFERTDDGKIWLVYSTQTYDSATGRTSWEARRYWTWEAELPQAIRSSIELQMSAD